MGKFDKVVDDAAAAASTVKSALQQQVDEQRAKVAGYYEEIAPLLEGAIKGSFNDAAASLNRVGIVTDVTPTYQRIAHGEEKLSGFTLQTHREFHSENSSFTFTADHGRRGFSLEAFVPGYPSPRFETSVSFGVATESQLDHHLADFLKSVVAKFGAR